VRSCARKQREASSTKAPQQAVNTNCEHEKKKYILGQPLLDGDVNSSCEYKHEDILGQPLPYHGTATGCEQQLFKGASLRLPKPLSDQFPVRVCSRPLLIINRL